MVHYIFIILIIICVICIVFVVYDIGLRNYFQKKNIKRPTAVAQEQEEIDPAESSSPMDKGLIQ